MEGGCNSKHYWLMELLLDRTNYFNRFFDDFLYVKISGPRRFFILFSCENGKVQISISSVSQTKQLVTESGNRDQILHATSLSLFSNLPGPLQITSCVKIYENYEVELPTKKSSPYFTLCLLFPANLDPSSLTPGGSVVSLVCGFRKRDNSDI